MTYQILCSRKATRFRSQNTLLSRKGYLTLALSRGQSKSRILLRLGAEGMMIETALNLFSFIFTFRIEICRNPHDRQLCKKISAVQIFSRKQCLSLQNFRTNMKFPHELAKFTHLFILKFMLFHR